MEALGVRAVHQFHELQAEYRVHPQPLCQFQGGVFAPRADAAVVQLVGEDYVKGPDRRAVLQEVPQLIQEYAPFHVEHQHAQGLRGLSRGRGQVVDFRLGKWGNHGHDLRLGGVVQQGPQTLPLLVGQSFHVVRLLLFGNRIPCVSGIRQDSFPCRACPAARFRVYWEARDAGRTCACPPAYGKRRDPEERRAHRPAFTGLRPRMGRVRLCPPCAGERRPCFCRLLRL